MREPRILQKRNDKPRTRKAALGDLGLREDGIDVVISNGALIVDHKLLKAEPNQF